ncbi:putative alpha-1,2-mannosidase [Microbacterium halimionae]|uniref:Putative alpha-1,2-mannosidase n=1 Tax=Microbacterium halimionae TaxID=1526413 RepID=A0A7W3PM35_9MICO|nr:glycoside hydrolase domain-containing protein [Microbacterium halimionae]MBA8817185.1 putative alpha-1,2-mannosidase [Microbacterium halimionae]NII94635.1 putative alpha-1,2-mannosidase [Microbacterium halimionae]
MSLSTRSLRLVAVGVLAALVGTGLVPAAAIAAPGEAKVETNDFAALVNSFVSTEDDFGQDLPGAEAPNSIIKINPMTTPGRSHSGYDYAEDQIAGFTHTNLNGVGGSGGGGDLLVVPTYESYTSRPSTNTYAKNFSHDDEEAEPGYYGVDLQTTKGAILAEATTDVRTGQDRFTFPQAGTASVVVDLRNNFTSRRDASISYEKLGDGRVTLSGEFTGHFNGYDYRMYYHAESTSAVKTVRTWGGSGALGASKEQKGTDIGAVLEFNVAAGEQVGLTVAISPISAAQARTDLGVEMGDRSFEEVRSDTKADWNEILGRLAVTASETSDPDGELQELFYTHLYRMFGSPVNATSTSGTYRGLDGEIRTAEGYTHYDGWGFWDDFRKYEVLAVGYPEVFSDMAQSVVDLYSSFAKTGSASLSNRVHSVPTVRFERAAIVVADAVAKGADLRGLEEAWPALVSQSQGGYANADNVKRGYIANEVDDTLGTAYDDTAMATIADALGRTDEADAYRLRAANWTNLYKDDAVTLADGSKAGLVFPKDADGKWSTADPERFEAGNVYQGTLWQYNWYVAGDMGGMIEKMGGEDATLSALSFMFGEQAPNDGKRMLHANANEIDLQAPYLFNYVGEPSKTQHWVRSIYTKETWNRYIATGSTNEAPTGGGEFNPPVKTKVYQNSPQGFLPTMDNDTGTMSSMFVAAAIGLFPVAAGSDEYQIGSPFFENVSINYESGRTFDIAANGVSPDDYYIQSATLDGEGFDRTWVTYDQLTSGGSLSFEMADEPSDWAADGVAASSLSDELPTSVYEPTSAISLDSREFVETETGDGSIGNTIELTITNGRFSGRDGDDLIASGAISAHNVPEGLDLRATRSGDRSVTLHLDGAATTSGVLESIDDLGIEISDAAFSRMPSTGPRDFELKVTFVGASLSADRTTVLAAPDGTVDATVAMAMNGATFAGAAGRDLIADGVLTVSGLPAGVTVAGVLRSPTELDLRLGGSLGDAQSASFTLVFADGALNGVHASSLRGDGVSGLRSLTLEVDREWRSQLAALLADADLVERGSYSTASFTAFAAARESARTTLADDKSSEDAVRAELDALTRAADALQIAPASDRVVLDGITFGDVAFDDDFSTDRLSEYTTYGDSAEPAAALAVDAAEGVLTATADGRRWSHIAFPAEPGDSFALVVEPRSFAATGASEDSLFLGLTDGVGNRVHSWFNNSRGESGFDAVVGGEGRNLNTGNQSGLSWQPGDRLATVVDHGTITSWIEQNGSWRKLRAGALDGVLTAEQLQSWKPTVSLRLDTGTISLDRVTLLRADSAAAVLPARIEAEEFTSSSGGSLIAEGTSPSGNVGGTYDGGELVYEDSSFGTGPLATVTVRSSTRDERVGANPRLEFYLDEKSDAGKVASVSLPKTGGWGNYVTTTLDLDRPVSGRHTLIVVMHSDPIAGQSFQYVSNLDWWEFAPAADSVEPADRSALQAAVAGAQDAKAQEDRYVAMDFRVFLGALNTATKVADDASATQGEVDEALRVLEAAHGQLVWKVARTLPGLITQAEAVVREGYTSESLAALDAALDGARNVADDATYETYVSAFDSLKAALEGLATPGPGTEEPGTEEPGTEEPGTEEPGTEEPGTEEPGSGKPSFIPAAPSADGSDLPLVFQDVITATVSGRQVTVGGLGGGEWHFGYVFSAPRALGWSIADAGGEATMMLPSDLPAGVHRLAVLDGSGSLVGWTEITVAVTSSLPATGADASPMWWAGLIAAFSVLIGAVLVVRRRRSIKL